MRGSIDFRLRSSSTGSGTPRRRAARSAHPEGWGWRRRPTPSRSIARSTFSGCPCRSRRGSRRRSSWSGPNTRCRSAGWRRQRQRDSRHSSAPTRHSPAIRIRSPRSRPVRAQRPPTLFLRALGATRLVTIDQSPHEAHNDHCRGRESASPATQCAPPPPGAQSCKPSMMGTDLRPDSGHCGFLGGHVCDVALAPLADADDFATARLPV